MTENKMGTLSVADIYSKQGRLEEWIQLFLRGEGHNNPFADGLLKEKRYYYGPVKTDITHFCIPEGAPDYLTKPNDIEWFFIEVNKMIKSYQTGWDMPPLIVQYAAEKYEVNDGRHRLEALRQMGVIRSYAIFWTTDRFDYKELLEKEEVFID